MVQISGSLLTFLAFLILSGSVAVLPPTASAQQARGHGIGLVTDWPDAETKQSGRFDVLPFIDTLSIAYRYQDVEGRPDLSVVLEWTPGEEGIYEGEKRRLRDVEGVPAIIGLALSADVFSRGVRVAAFSLTVDSMVVGPSPDIIRIDVPDLSWDNVFVDTSPEAARTIFDVGFELRNVRIVGAGFALFDEGRTLAATEVQKRPTEGKRPPQVAPRRPKNVSIYRHPAHVDIGFDVFWLIRSGSKRIRFADDGPRENIGRGSLSGERRSRSGRGGEQADRSRGSEGGDDSAGGVDKGDRSADRETKRDRERSKTRIPSLITSKDKDDDDDDDDNKLVPYAVAAVAAAGVLAAVGGTIGYYGNARYAPIGLTSGFVRDEGGLLLQVAVNEAFIAGEGGPKRLAARALSFGQMFGAAGIEPALGGGVMATSRGGVVEYEPSVSIGAVGRRKAMLFYAGYDLLQGSPEFSFAVNLRRTGLWGKKSQ